jgi:hypothetical protein
MVCGKVLLCSSEQEEFVFLIAFGEKIVGSGSARAYFPRARAGHMQKGGGEIKKGSPT